MKIPPQFRPLLCSTSLALVSPAAGCFSVKTEHKIEPIHITTDVNLRLEQELAAVSGRRLVSGMIRCFQ